MHEGRRIELKKIITTRRYTMGSGASKNSGDDTSVDLGSLGRGVVVAEVSAFPTASWTEVSELQTKFNENNLFVPFFTTAEIRNTKAFTDVCKVLNIDTMEKGNREVKGK